MREVKNTAPRGDLRGVERQFEYRLKRSDDDLSTGLFRSPII